MKYRDLTGRIIGAAMEVHKHLGNGFQEVIYQRALSIELNMQNIHHEREKAGGRVCASTCPDFGLPIPGPGGQGFKPILSPRSQALPGNAFREAPPRVLPPTLPRGNSLKMMA